MHIGISQIMANLIMLLKPVQSLIKPKLQKRDKQSSCILGFRQRDTFIHKKSNSMIKNILFLILYQEKGTI